MIKKNIKRKPIVSELYYCSQGSFKVLCEFIFEFGKKREDLDNIQGYAIDDIPSYLSLKHWGKVIDNIYIEFDWQKAKYLAEGFDRKNQYSLLYVYNEEHQKTDDRCLQWLENDAFLLWAVRQDANEYYTYSEKLLRLLLKLGILDSPDNLIDDVPERFKIKKEEWQLLLEDGRYAEEFFNNDDFILWAIRHYLNYIKEEYSPSLLF